jgi:hypothetical protein
MKFKNLSIALCAISLALLTGCRSEGEMKGGSTNTSISLAGKNYKLLKGGAQGKDYGFWFLFIPIVSPNYADAKANLYKSVDVPLTGKAIALANQTEDRSRLCLILVTIPRISITADVIEFIDDANPVPVKNAP